MLDVNCSAYFDKRRLEQKNKSVVGDTFAVVRTITTCRHRISCAILLLVNVEKSKFLGLHDEGNAVYGFFVTAAKTEKSRSRGGSPASEPLCLRQRFAPDAG